MMHTKPHWHTLLVLGSSGSCGWLPKPIDWSDVYRWCKARKCFPPNTACYTVWPNWKFNWGAVQIRARILAGPAYPTLGEHVCSSLRDSWPWVSPEKHRATWQRAGLDLNNPAVQSNAQGLKAVWAAHQIWWPRFRALMCPQGGQ